MPDYRRNLLDTIYQLESSAGKNKRAYKPNSVGALGGYQLTPGAFEEVQKANPAWLGKNFSSVAINDQLANQAATEYLRVLVKQLASKGVPLTNTNLLAAYHSGSGNVARGTLGPYGRDYISKARALAGVRPGEGW